MNTPMNTPMRTNEKTKDAIRLVDKGDLKYFRTEIPNLYDDAGLSVYAFRLLIHIKRRAGGSSDGYCNESVRNMANHCKMSVGAVAQARKELVDSGFITVESTGRRTTDVVFIRNIWLENMTAYSTNPVSPEAQIARIKPTSEPVDSVLSVHHTNTECSPHEHSETASVHVVNMSVSPHEHSSLLRKNHEERTIADAHATAVIASNEDEEERQKMLLNQEAEERREASNHRDSMPTRLNTPEVSTQASKQNSPKAPVSPAREIAPRAKRAPREISATEQAQRDLFQAYWEALNDDDGEKYPENLFHSNKNMLDRFRRDNITPEQMKLIVRRALVQSKGDPTSATLYSLSTRWHVLLNAEKRTVPELTPAADPYEPRAFAGYDGEFKERNRLHREREQQKQQQEREARVGQ